MYSKGGGGGEQEDESDDCRSGGGGGMPLPPVFPVTGENDVLVIEDPVKVANGLGMGLGSCLSFALYADKLVGREETLKASGGVTDLVSSLGLYKKKSNNNTSDQRKRKFPFKTNNSHILILETQLPINAILTKIINSQGNW